jgi:hypothetical protein
MLAIAACFAVSFALMIVVALLDKRHPDRLSRHGRQLTGLPIDAPRASELASRQREVRASIESP